MQDVNNFSGSPSCDDDCCDGFEVTSSSCTTLSFSIWGLTTVDMDSSVVDDGCILRLVVAPITSVLDGFDFSAEHSDCC